MRGVSAVRTIALTLVTLTVALPTARLLHAEDEPPTRADPNVPTTQPRDANAPQVEPLSGPAASLVSGLIGSKHDFTGEGKAGRNLCLPCHTPHLANVAPPRLDERPTSTLPLQPYQHLDVELDGWSLLCLGCHDGITASDVYSSSHAVTVTSQMGDTRLGTRGLRSHPVGIEYPVGDRDYHSRAAVEAKGLLMPNGRIQCGTCHDAHNTHGYPGMLKISNERSEMCLTCHRR